MTKKPCVVVFRFDVDVDAEFRMFHENVVQVVQYPHASFTN